MARFPIIPLALIAAAAALTARFDAVLAAGAQLAPAEANAEIVIKANPDNNNRVGAALAEDLRRIEDARAKKEAEALNSVMLEAAEKRIDEKLQRLERQEQATRRSQAAPVSRAAVSQVARRPVPARAAPFAADDRMGGLVKMYQAMRPKDAARIFEQLDLNVQVDVAAQMRERAMAAILAEMSPKAAGRLTMALAGHSIKSSD